MSAARVDNLQTGRLRQTALLVGAGTLLALSLAGAAARPAVSRRVAEGALAEARQRADERGKLAAEYARFEQAGGEARHERALAVLRRAVPAARGELDVYGFFRLQARAAGIELEALELEEPRDAGLERLGDVIALRTVRLSGRSPLAAVLALLAAVRATGQPLAVEEFQQLGRDPGGRVRWTIELALIEAHPPDSFHDQTADTPTDLTATEMP